MEDEDDDDGWVRDQLLADAGGHIRSLCETLLDAVDDTNTFVVDEELPGLRPAVTEWMDSVSALMADTPGGMGEHDEVSGAPPAAFGPIDVSAFFPALWEIDESDHYSRDQELDDQRSWVATLRVDLASHELYAALRDLDDFSYSRPTDSSPVSDLRLRSERLVRRIEQWHDVWMLCLHGYYGVHGRYPGLAGDAVEMFESWLGEMRFETELRRFLEEGNVQNFGPRSVDEPPKPDSGEAGGDGGGE